MSRATFYKFLMDRDGAAPFSRDFRWPMPTGDEPGEWVEVEGKLSLCSRGLHACRPDQLVQWIRPVLTVFEYAEGAEIIEDDEKICGRQGRIVRVVEAWDESSCRIFAADCADRALERAGVTDERCWDATKAARLYAAGDIDAEALAAAWAAAMVAAAWAAAGDAAGATAGDAAIRAAAWAAAWAAARDAALDAEQRWQCAHLLEMVGEPVPEGLRGGPE